MSLFKNKINIETVQVFSIGGKIEVGNYIDKGGYRTCNIKDCYGNKYWRTYQVIYAEANNLPKHLWPVDENGNRYEPDHIIPVREGGTDAARGLGLLEGRICDCCKGRRNKHGGFQWRYKPL